MAKDLDLDDLGLSQGTMAETKEFKDLSSTDQLFNLLEGKDKALDLVKSITEEVLPEAVRKLQAYNYKFSTLDGFIPNNGRVPKLAVKNRAVPYTGSKEGIDSGIKIYEPKPNFREEFDTLLQAAKEGPKKYAEVKANYKTFYNMALKEKDLVLVESKPSIPKLAVITMPEAGIVDIMDVYNNTVEFETPKENGVVTHVDTVKLVLHEELIQILAILLGSKIKEGSLGLAEGQMPGNYVVIDRTYAVEKEVGGDIITMAEVKQFLRHSERKAAILTSNNYVPIKQYKTMLISDMDSQIASKQAYEYLSDYLKKGVDFTAEAKRLIEHKKLPGGDFEVTTELLDRSVPHEMPAWFDSKTIIKDPEIAIKSKGNYIKLVLGKDYKLEDFPVGKYLADNQFTPAEILDRVTTRKKQQGLNLTGENVSKRAFTLGSNDNFNLTSLSRVELSKHNESIMRSLTY